MDKQKAHVLVDYNKCVPCSDLVCVGVCPLGILELGVNKKPQIMDLSSCTQCKVCANLCPTRAITVTGNMISSNK
jgi:NAD-dependent dihydropyrimidine dehydrogenase PreA subunit